MSKKIKNSYFWIWICNLFGFTFITSSAMSGPASFSAELSCKPNNLGQNIVTSGIGCAASSPSSALGDNIVNCTNIETYLGVGTPVRNSNVPCSKGEAVLNQEALKFLETNCDRNVNFTPTAQTLLNGSFLTRWFAECDENYPY